jgi:TetR/AcrR family transcriptional regulator, tetracycline repressor protein
VTPRLSRDKILSSALELVEAEGLGALSLRKVAARWEVTPMALYWHFKDKSALLDGMVERILAEQRPAGEDLRALALSLLRALRAHPALAEIVPDRIMRTRPGLAVAERVVGELRAGGHSPEIAAQLAIFLLNGLVSLVVRRPGEVTGGSPETRETLIGEKRVRLEALPEEEFPHLAVAGEFFLDLPDEEGYYERGVALILDAVARQG